MRLFIVLAVLLVSLGVAAPAFAHKISYAGHTWSTYQRVGNLGQIWRPSQVSVHGSTLIERINGNVAGGIGSKSYQRYGTYTVRFRFTPGAGKICIGLYGRARHQEIDFAETPKRDPRRSAMTSTLHWSHANHMQHFKLHVNLTKWHTVQLRWTRHRLLFLMDGKVWAHTTRHVPNYPMHPAIQTAGANVAGRGAPARLIVSRFKVS
jgi:hypothetical protein